MGSVFDSLKDEMAAVVRDVFGSSWTYTTPGGTSYTCDAIYDEAGKAFEIRDGVKIMTTGPSLDLRPGDLPVAPEVDATATDGERLFHVAAVDRTSADNYLLRLREV